MGFFFSGLDVCFCILFMYEERDDKDRAVITAKDDNKINHTNTINIKEIRGYSPLLLKSIAYKRFFFFFFFFFVFWGDVRHGQVQEGLRLLRK